MTVAEIILSAFTPLMVAVVGYFLNRRLKSIDSAQWQNRKIIEKRLEIYERLAPELNKVFCFCHFLGYWKGISPDELLETKRSLDKNVNIYRHLLSDEFYESYDSFIHTAFRTFVGHGKDALIRSAICNHWADRRKHANYDWEVGYDSMLDTERLPTDKEISDRYLATMDALRDSIGV